MVRRTSDLPPAESKLQNWAYDLNGRVPINWSIKAQGLARAAAILYARGQDARRLKASVFSRDAMGLLVARSQPFTPEELDVFPDVEMYRVAFMLLGMAIENLTKGILVGRNPTWVQDGALNKLVTGHDLESLVRRCDVVVEGEDRVALRMLTEHVVWAGRYHIPRSADRIARLTTKQKLRAQSDEYLDAVFNFGERLIAQLDVLLDDEHTAEKTAERVALAQAPPAPPTSDDKPKDFFDPSKPRFCPYCSRPVVFPILSARPGPQGNGKTVTLHDPQHPAPVCDRWVRAQEADAYGLALHVFAGRTGEPFLFVAPV